MTEQATAPEAEAEAAAEPEPEIPAWARVSEQVRAEPPARPRRQRRRRRQAAAEAAAEHDRLTEVALKAAWDYVFVTRRGGRGDPDLTGLREALQALRVHQARRRRDEGRAMVDGGG